MLTACCRLPAILRLLLRQLLPLVLVVLTIRLAKTQAQLSNTVLNLRWDYQVEELTSDLSFLIVTNDLTNPTNWRTEKQVKAQGSLLRIVNFTNTYGVAVTSSAPFNFFSVRASNQFGISGLATK